VKKKDQERPAVDLAAGKPAGCRGGDGRTTRAPAARGVDGSECRQTVQRPFLMLRRGIEAWDLFTRHPNAFRLLTFIAWRITQYGRSPRPGCERGEVCLGHLELWRELRMTEAAFRAAKRLLKRIDLAAFRATCRGTIARLTGTTVFDLTFATNGEFRAGSGTDAGTDARTDARTDAGTDARTDARTDAGTDLSAPAMPSRAMASDASLIRSDGPKDGPKDGPRDGLSADSGTALKDQREEIREKTSLSARGEGDRAFEILVACPKLREITVEQYQAVRRQYATELEQADWIAAVEYAARKACLMNRPIGEPGLFLDTRVEEFVGRQRGENTRATDAEDRWEAPQDARLLAMREAAKRERGKRQADGASVGVPA